MAFNVYGFCGDELLPTFLTSLLESVPSFPRIDMEEVFFLGALKRMTIVHQSSACAGREWNVRLDDRKRSDMVPSRWPTIAGKVLDSNTMDDA